MSASVDFSKPTQKNSFLTNILQKIRKPDLQRSSPQRQVRGIQTEDSPPSSLPFSTKLGILLFHLGLTFTALPAISAERVYLNYGPLQFAFSVESLATFAKEGKVEDDLKLFANYVDKQQREQLRELLVTSADLSPVAVAQFFYSPQGEALLRQAGELIQTKAGQSGFYALRAALIRAAASEEGLTPLNVLKQFPTTGIRLNTSRGFELLNQLSEVTQETARVSQIIEQESLSEVAATFPVPNFGQLPNLQDRGVYNFTKETLQINDFRRDRVFPVDLYIPQIPGEKKIPVIVISHGLGSDRSTFAYLAQHLASYGFAVAVPEHPGSNAEQIQALIRGLANQIAPPRELIDRPLDIQYLLEVLASTPAYQNLNLQEVGVIGQSFGAYTALALAGADLNFEKLQQDCPALANTLNISLLLQCDALKLPPFNYNLQSDRVKAVIAINPLTSRIFGQSGLSNISIPTMIVSGSNDTVTPALAEQIRPFTWLTNPEKYLVLLKGGTHFSTLTEESGSVPIPPQVIGPNPNIAQEYVEALSTAFFKTYIAEEPEYRDYLSAPYAQVLSQDPIPLFLVESLSAERVP